MISVFILYTLSKYIILLDTLLHEYVLYILYIFIKIPKTNHSTYHGLSVTHNKSLNLPQSLRYP